MVKLGNEAADKSQLVTEICNISSLSISCTHRHYDSPIKSPFIDWYLVLRVNENAGKDVIRKQYRNLALLLHPDKNKHPKAETAFKLVSEAHLCLSDSAKREVFDLDRRKKFCIQCNRVPYNKSSPASLTEKVKSKGIFHPKKLNFFGNTKRMKDLRNRLVEEATTIEKCLLSNFGSRRESPVAVRSTELPVFNPSDYNKSKGYPHHRVINYKKLDKFTRLMEGNGFFQTPFRGESPVFQCRSESEHFKYNRCRRPL